MGIRSSRVATGVLVLAILMLTPDQGWAIREALGPSKDEWGLKYDLTVRDADADKVTVVFRLADEGRLKPFYSLDVIAWGKPSSPRAGRTYDLNVPIKLKPTPDGSRAGEVQIRKEFVDRALIRIITLTVDGKRKPSGGAFYDIPIAKFLNKAPATPNSP